MSSFNYTTKKCKVCGNENPDIINSFDSIGNYSCVMCHNCGMSSPNSYRSETRWANEEAVDKWNKLME